jgi:signal transduction histidine kinase
VTSSSECPTTSAGAVTTLDLADTPRWDLRAQRFVDYSGYALLAVGFVLVVTQPQPLQDRLIAILLSVVAAAWITLYMRVPAFRGARAAPTRIYFFGFVAIAAVMMLHNPLFFPLMIAGFFHAYVLRPWPVTLAGVTLTSFLINTILAEFPAEPTFSDLAIYATVIVVQSLSIAGGVIVGQKATDLSEERRKTVADLRAALEENAGLHTQLMIQAREAGVLDERQRLAREIHDTLAQGLTGIITQLEAAMRTRERRTDQGRHVETAMRLARESLSDARRSVLALGPEPLDNNARLPDALAQVGQRWSAASGVPTEVTTTGTSQRLHPEIEVTLLRVAQEALTNVAKHASASRVAVTLSYMNDVVTLDVRDDGAGFSPPDGTHNGAGRTGGFGVTAMRQRVDEVGGTLAIESEHGGGTSISASVPAVPPGLQVPAGLRVPADG